MKIHQIYTNSPLRNFTYLVEDSVEGVYCIDPFDGEEVFNSIQNLGKKLIAIINTHEHPDHVCGNEKLLELSGCGEVWAHIGAKGIAPGFSRALVQDELIEVAGGSLEVLVTPGHTFSHICLLFKEGHKQKAIFSGDTVFNAGVGHVRLGGEVETLYKTISSTFYELDDDVILYPGHDYLENNLRFTLDREPSNEFAKNFLELVLQSDSTKMVTNIEKEKLMNSFFRFDKKELVDNLVGDTSSEKQVFLRLRELRNNW